MSHKKIIVALASLGILAIILFFTNNLRSSQHAKEELEQRVNFREISHTTGAPPSITPDREYSLAARDSSDRSTEEAHRNFEFSKSCAKFTRLQGFAEAQGIDKNSWMNSEAALERLSEEDLSNLQHNLDYVTKHADRCSQPANIRELYSSTLLAARSGNVEAMRCYILAPWDYPDGQRPRQLEIEYRENYVSVKNAAIEAGDWNSVNILIAAYSSPTHGLSAIAFQNDPAEAYGYARLRQIGAMAGNDNELLDQTSRNVEFLRQEIPASVAKEKESWATEIYMRNFAHAGPVRAGTGCDF